MLEIQNLRKIYVQSNKGIHPFDRGGIQLNSVDLKENPAQFKGAIGYAPDNSGGHENLRGYEYLNFSS